MMTIPIEFQLAFFVFSPTSRSGKYIALFDPSIDIKNKNKYKAANKETPEKISISPNKNQKLLF